MPNSDLRRFLGPPPLFRGLLRWTLAAIFPVLTWQIYLHFPILGLIAVGIAPVVVLFLFFRGLNMFTRTVAYLKTRSLASTLNMRPTWGIAVGGFLLLDEQGGRWIIDGKTGTVSDLSRIHCHSDWLSFRLELYEGKTCPTVRYGLESTESLMAAAHRFQNTALSLTGHKPELTFRDERLEVVSDSDSGNSACPEKKRGEERNLSWPAS